MTASRSIGLALGIALAFAAHAAAAQTSLGPRADAGASDEVTALRAQIDHESETLSTADCGAACRALASMTRAADRLCALDPGPECASARARVDAATQRVRAACPECATDTNEQRAAAPAAEKAETVSAKGGGCASCTSSRAEGPGGLVPPIVAGVVVAAMLRRRRRIA